MTITFGNNQSRSDIFRVLIEPRTLDVEANMAIDRGLWNLHKTQSRYMQGTLQSALWSSAYDGDSMASTSATLNAFGINNHRINGNRLEDPVRRERAPRLRAPRTATRPGGMSPQPAGNPDTDGNGRR